MRPCSWASRQHARNARRTVLRARQRERLQIGCSCDHHPFSDHAFEDGLCIPPFDNDGGPIWLKTVFRADAFFYEFMRRWRQRSEKNERTFITKRKIWRFCF